MTRRTLDEIEQENAELRGAVSSLTAERSELRSTLSVELAQATVTCRKYSQQLEHDQVQDSARRYDEPIKPPRESGRPQPAGTAGLCDTMRPNATMCDYAAGVAQLVERQPSKLNVDGSSPFARFDACDHIRLLPFAFVRKRQVFARRVGGC